MQLGLACAWAIAVSAVAGCGTRGRAPAVAPPADAASGVDARGAVLPPLDLAALAQAAGVAPGDACVVVDGPAGVVRSDAACGQVRLRPASTFKIANTVIGAEAGLLTTPDSRLRYDPVRYPPDTISNPAWRHDQSVRDALKVSAVPLFRLLAIEIGAPRMTAALRAFGYGNASIDGGLDQFWLTGALAISADEQVDFLRRLRAGELPVAAASAALVVEAVPRQVAGAATLRWKTGTGEIDGERQVGWLVGWVDRPDGVHTFACWIRLTTHGFARTAAARLAVCRGALAGLGLFPLDPA
ncbi:MAG: penicillin-binding transpeptidase domain-containing protein [Kofleriaceae bacterium]